MLKGEEPVGFGREAIYNRGTIREEMEQGDEGRALRGCVRMLNFGQGQGGRKF